MTCGSSILPILLFHLNDQPQEKCLYVKRVRALRTSLHTKLTLRYKIYSANNTAYSKRISSIPAQKPNAERDNTSRLMKITDIPLTLNTENFKIPVDKSPHSVTMFIEYVKT